MNRASCAARGCPLPGGMLDSGSYVCRHHYGMHCNFWPKITGVLREHEALLGLIQRILSDAMNDRSGRSLGDAEALEKLATWAKDHYPDLMPLPGEKPKSWAYRADSYLAAKGLEANGQKRTKKMTGR